MLLHRGIEYTSGLEALVRASVEPTNNMRLDGRKVTEYRPIQVEIKRCPVYHTVTSIVQWCETRIVCSPTFGRNCIHLLMYVYVALYSQWRNCKTLS
jgi:hypothetical protein